MLKPAPTTSKASETSATIFQTLTPRGGGGGAAMIGGGSEGGGGVYPGGDEGGNDSSISLRNLLHALKTGKSNAP